MANNRVNVDISANTTAFVQGMNKASDSVEKYETDIRKVSESTGNFRKEFSQAKKEVLNLAQAYAKLDDEAKASTFGREMARQLNEAKEKAAQMTDMMGDIQAELKNMASDTSLLDTLSQGMGVFMNAASAAMGVVAQFTGNEEDAKRAVVAFTTAQSTLNTLTQLGNALQKQSSLMLGIRKIQDAALTAAIRVRTAAENRGTAATVAATIAQKALNVVAKANPYVLLATAILALGAAYLAFSKNLKETEEAQIKAKREAEELKEQQERESKQLEELNNTVATSKTKFFELQTQYKLLKTEGDKQEWIKKNKSAFENLGISITTVKTAEDVFIKNTDAVIDALLQRAIAAKKAEQAADDIIELEKKLNTRSRATGDFYTPYKKGDDISDEVAKAAGIRTKAQRTHTQTLGGMASHTVIDDLTPEEERKLNTYLIRQSKLRREQYHADVEYQIGERKRQLTESVKLLSDANKKLAALGDAPTDDKQTKNPKKEIEVKKQEIDTISEAINEYKKLTDEKAKLNKYIENGVVTGEGTKAVQDEINAIDNKIKELVKKWKINPASIEFEVKLKAKELTIEDILGGNFDKTINGYGNAISELQKKMKDMQPGDEKWDTYADKIKEYQKSLEELETAYNEKFITPQEAAIKKFEEMQEAAEKMGATFGSLGEMTNSIGSIFKAMGEDAAAAAMQVITATMDMVAQVIPQIVSLIGAKQAESMASGTASAAKLPFPANLGAIANVIATVLSTFATIANVMNSAGKHANGGIVGGSSYHGDKIWSRLNSGEMVLNTRQQRNLFNMLDMGLMPQRGGTNVTVQGVIRGTDLMLVQKNTSKVLSKTGNKIIF